MPPSVSSLRCPIARRRFPDLRGLKGGRVSIGVVSTAKYFAPHALGAFSRAFPSVEIRLEVGNRSAIIAALEANTLDMALTGRPPEHLEVDRAPIGRTRM